MTATQKFTNSGLVIYTKLSSHNSGLRNHNIDTITVHTMAGNMTAENCANYFASNYTQASSNYCIGSDGHIAMSVPEKYRSWCSSSNDNDQRAITIEVASTTTTEPFPCTEAAWNALVDLCVDICQRNNIPELRWKADKSLIGQADKQNLTVHRWFANKSCPGEYLYSRMGDLARQVNAKLKSNTATISSTTVNNLTKDSNENYIWSFFKGKLLSDYAVAGIMGCIYGESGFIPNNLQNSYEKKLGMNDEQYTTAVDKNTYKNFASDSAGYGLCQWTDPTVKKNLLNFAKKKGKSIGDLYIQCEFLWSELSTKQYFITNIMEVFKKSTSVAVCNYRFLKYYEMGGNNISDSLKASRAKYAQEIFNRHAKISSSNTNVSPVNTTLKVPYMVKVVTNQLNVRKGPGTNYDSIAIIKDRGVYTIIEETTGNGAKQWGKLKSGGWIALDYCELYTKNK